ncbi:MAG: ribosome biogenesis GTPase Der [Roseibacillus sp.]|jgi:GTP-binding protein|nr:ribosome biogenesis GTPase Der [Roseibacillus sp.]MBP35289.1 ribosome biogenesis GTPase Der [Roseibacillus sp.]MCP4731031.1 ribosome biogenesis GTPase Der [Roseibacillus sp.]MDP7655709.1 ribosome biogenesis GTPase Der [Roseibacillus sp.]HJM64349.1 ribosome biogenesis GTPase Der [Roseibacillus sp.]|tara:strand:+ start:31941 stop:33329 length:1389 start_codon:yes stop_codon:yes gene_type:complete
MVSPTRKPVVALVGRPNVGKSALFNRLAGRTISIVHDQPGVTRDRISAPCSLTDVPCDLVDTGGIGALADADFAEVVSTEAQIAMDTAEIILFLVDAREGLTPVDESIAQQLRKAAEKVCLVINKADHEKLDHIAGDFARLGLGAGLSVSAAHGRNFRALLNELDTRLTPFTESAHEAEKSARVTGLKIVVIGKPNAGKSSLVNAILDDERTIVSEVAGTTRDAVDIPYDRAGERHTLIDTAGLRQRSRMDTSVEVFSAMRAERSIRRSDLCLLVVDLSAGISAQDRKIARLVQREQKPCIIIANKWDLYHPDAPKRARMEEAEEAIRTELFFLHYAPFICVSAREKQELDRIFGSIRKVREDAQDIIGTGELNRLLADALRRNPPPASKRHRRRLKILYATAAVNERYSAIPVPRYILFVNDKRLLTDSYQSYLENTLRKKTSSLGLPVNFSARSRRKPEM